MIQRKIQLLIKKSIKKLQREKIFPEFEIPEIKIEYPEREEHGEYSTNLAILIGKEIKKNPLEVGEVLKEEILKNKLDFFEKIEVAPPGFINFFLGKKALLQELKKILREKENYGKIERKRKKTILIDYSSPNIAKPFGIGHLRSTIIGQAIYNLYKFLGWKCIGDNHLGDWGTQYGNLVVAIKKWGNEFGKLTIENLEKLYVRFHQEAENNPSLKEEGKKEFKKLEEGNREARKIWEKCVKISLKEFNRIYKILGIKIDFTLGESFYEPMLKEIVKEAKKKKIAKESQGALIIEFPNQEFPPAIILKSDGTTTYFTRDLATIKYRLKRWKPDLIVYEVGIEQKLHFQQLFKAVEIFGWAKKEKFFHLAHGLYRLKEGKFSTRKGLTIHLEDVLEEAIERAREIIEKSGSSKLLSKKEKERVARMIGIGAIKYNDLKQHPSKDIIFDWEKVLNLKGNSAPYLQYTFARAKSVLRKARFKIPFQIKIKDFKEERKILSHLVRFPEILVEAAKKFSPNLICDFLFELAQKFNFFYDRCPIINAKPKTKKIFRLSLTFAVAQVLKTGLSLLGIQTPEKI